MDLYGYSGPVVIFGQIVEPNWSGVTRAATPARAKSNLTYQWKKAHGKTAASRVELPGKVILMETDNGR